MRRPNDTHIRMLLLGAVAVAAAALASGAAAFGPAESAASHCSYRVYAPTNHFGVVANTSFTCTTSHSSSTALVVMQKLTAGKWRNVAKKSTGLNVQAGKRYTVQAKWAVKADCPNGQQPRWMMRTHFLLKLPSVLTINYTTPGIAVYPPCQ